MNAERYFEHFTCQNCHQDIHGPKRFYCGSRLRLIPSMDVCQPCEHKLIALDAVPSGKLARAGYPLIFRNETDCAGARVFLMMLEGGR